MQPLPSCLSERAIAQLQPEEKLELLGLLEQREKLIEQSRIDSFYPDAGPFRRELYPKHLQFFAAGAVHRERLFLAANRVGKTEGVGAYEVVLHMTGRYPAWWQGRRWSRPVRVWAAGETGKTTRDIIQQKLLGPKKHYGTGMIPAQYLAGTRPKQGIAEAEEIVYVENVSGGLSRLVFKSYDQGEAAFQGQEQDVIWLDEEPPYGIYTECLVRTMTTDGMVISTFMPLKGATEMVRHFMPELGPIE